MAEGDRSTAGDPFSWLYTKLPAHTTILPEHSDQEVLAYWSHLGFELSPNVPAADAIGLLRRLPLTLAIDWDSGWSLIEGLHTLGRPDLIRLCEDQQKQLDDFTSELRNPKAPSSPAHSVLGLVQRSIRYLKDGSPTRALIATDAAAALMETLLRIRGIEPDQTLFYSLKLQRSLAYGDLGWEEARVDQFYEARSFYVEPLVAQEPGKDRVGPSRISRRLASIARTLLPDRLFHATRAHFYRGQAQSLIDRGQPRAALAAFAVAQQIYEGPLATQAKYFNARAHLHIRQNEVLSSLERFDEALDACDEAYRLVREAPARPNVRASYLAWLHRVRGATLADAGRPREALDAYTAAEQIYRGDLAPQVDRAKRNLNARATSFGLRSLTACNAVLVRITSLLPTTALEAFKDDVLIGHVAASHLDRANTLSGLADYENALLAYRDALRLYSGPLARRKAYDQDRAQAYEGMGIAFSRNGDLAAAISCFHEAEVLYEGPLAAQRHLDANRAFFYAALGAALSEADLPELALETYRKASAILYQGPLADRSDLAGHRAILANNLGYALAQLNRPQEALAAYDEATRLHAGPLAHQGLFDTARTTLGLNRCLTLQTLGRIEDAFAAYHDADRLLRGSLAEQNEFEPLSALLHTTRGMLYRETDRNKAFAAYHAARRLYDGPLAGRPSLDARRARLSMLVAQLHARDDAPAALAAYDAAQRMYEGPLSDRPGVTAWKAQLAKERGDVLAAQGRQEDALRAYQIAETLYEMPAVRARHHRDSERGALYVKIAQLMKLLSDPHRWAQEMSINMMQMLELRPSGAAQEETDGYHLLRSQLRDFLTSWFRFCAHSGQSEHWTWIPVILGAIQGHDIALRLLDDADDPSAAESDECSAVLAQSAAADISTNARLSEQQLHLKMVMLEDLEPGAATGAYRTARRHLRDIDLEIQRLEAGAASSAVGGENTQLSASTSEQLKDLEGEHKSWSAYFAKLHAIFSRPWPGFEEMIDPYGKSICEKLKAALSAHEALILLLNVEDSCGRPGLQGAWILCRGVRPQWQALEGLDGIASDILAFSEQIAALDAVRPAAHAQRSSSPASASIRLETFWHDTKQRLQRCLWEPLRPYLEGIQHAVCITHGMTHLLPLELGKPQRPEISHHPGLVFFAHRRGLVGLHAEKRRFEDAVGLVGFAGSKSDIPYAAEEARMLAAYWQQRSVINVTGSLELLEAAGAIEFLHIACHGIPDAKNPKRIALEIGQAPPYSRPVMLNVETIRAGPVSARDIYLSTCIAGHIFEPLDGDPYGLVSALLQQGAELVVASLVPIPDVWGLLLALLTHQTVKEQGLRLDAALSDAKRRLRRGDWYAETEVMLRQHVAHVERHGPGAVATAHWYRQNRRLDHFRAKIAALTSAQTLGLQTVGPPIDELERDIKKRSAEDLVSELAEIAGEAVVRQRIPPPPHLDTLLYGYRVYGEVNQIRSPTA